MQKLGSILICMLLAAGSARAIATADNSISASNPTNYGYSINWDYVYKCNNSSSVAVDRYWVLTAAHVADDGFGTLTVNGETYTRQEVIYHDTADLALERYDKPFPGYYLLHDGEIFTTSGSGRNKITVFDELLMMGFGRTGVVTSVSFSNGPGGNGLKRWGTNKGSSTLGSTINSSVGGAAGDRSTTCFPTTFILGDTAYEAGAAQYDSGGPAFVSSDGEWKVAGINLYLIGSDPYTGNYLGEISSYRDWIISNIPDYDSDMDGLPDWWEAEYTGNSTSMVASADSDSDGFSNYQEYIADTNPTNAASFFEVSGFSALTNQTVWFNGSTGREYQVFYTTNDLADTNLFWTAANSPVAGTGTNSSITVTNTEEKAFYRLQATLP
jgi:hypothetical protein